MAPSVLSEKERDNLADSSAAMAPAHPVGAGKALNKLGVERFTKYGSEKLKTVNSKDFWKVVGEHTAQGSFKEITPMIQDVTTNQYLQRASITIGPLEFLGMEEPDDGN